MPEEVDDAVDSILEDNPDMDEEEAWAIAYDQHSEDNEKRAKLAKAAPNASVSKMEFEVSTEGSVGAIFKSDDDFVIWGPASVEVVDKEDDRIKAEALEDALPQLLKRKRLSYEHTDQIVGDILEGFETDEPVTVEINGKSFERTDFPTDVLKLDGMKPGLFVAGNVYNDTSKSQEVRKQIDEGEIDSYSISGEAIVTEMAVKDGQTFTDILKLDLSAVTLCKMGMNQKAKFDVVSKYADDSLSPQRAASLAKSRLNETMSQDNDVQKFVDALDETLDKRLPDGEIATKEDVENYVDQKLKAGEGSPADGTADRPDGRSDSPTNQEDEYSGDVEDWGEPPADDSDKVEDTQVSDDKNASATAKAETYSREELKSILPDDQFKAIEPVLERAGDDYGDDEPDVDPMDEKPPEMADEPRDEGHDEEEEMDPDPIMASKAMENLDLNRLSNGQLRSLMKAQDIEKTESGVSTGTSLGKGAQPAHAGSSDGSGVVKADKDAIAGDPALRKVYDEEGQPQI